MNIGLSNPFNYTGGKHRYLKDMQEVIPKGENLSVCDMFFGGGDLSTHLPKSWEISGYDINKQLIEMHNAILSGHITVKSVEDMVLKASLSKVDEDAYTKFKAVYNWVKDPLMLYVLTCHSNSNRIRFNGNGEQNLAFGKRTFNPSMKAKLADYINRIKSRDVFLYGRSSLGKDLNYYDLLLVDPPYLNTLACYNEKGGWKVEDEIALHLKLHEAHGQGIKFIYFGQIWSKGVENKYLQSFANGYNMKVLKNTTATCSANMKNVGETLEVMIWN